MRSHLAGELRGVNAGEQVRLGGWVHRVRDLGGLVFVDLRDRAGIVQVSFDPRWTPPDVMEQARALTTESVVSVDGEAALRPDDQRNSDLETGDVEVRARLVQLLGAADTPAIPVARGRGEKLAAEELRLRHRHLDLRRPELRDNIVLRHRLAQAVRRYFDSLGFLEVETPILTKPTPEGARDYLVPSRVHAGEFYALPQSPQLYKQLLMISGFDRYFQIARCFRDEDLRADRQPEFTQIDVEASFVGVEDVILFASGMTAALYTEAAIAMPPLQRMTHADAMERYGTDRPDLRYGLELFDASDLFAGADFAITQQALSAGGRVRGVRIPSAGAWSRKQVDELEALAKGAGAAGLLRVKRSGSELEGPLAKFLPSGAAERLEMRDGDLCLFVAGPHRVGSAALDRVRQEAARRLSLAAEGAHALVWVTDFPLFDRDEHGALTPMNHPFTSPHPDDLMLLGSAPEKARALAYDLVLNGTELGGGSIRIIDPALQMRIFRLLGLDEQTAEKRFGFLLEALRAGAPPHGGIAFGFDRIVMLLAGAQSLRDVIPFPKTTAARALFEGAPTAVPEAELKDLHLRVTE
ncbi:MAG TPA: aspartate--tRNA ligase [Gemmatimonadaceae bacterium]